MPTFNWIGNTLLTRFGWYHIESFGEEFIAYREKTQTEFTGTYEEVKAKVEAFLTDVGRN